VTDPISRPALATAARLARWPALTIAGRAVAGPEAWDRIVNRTRPAERVALVRRLARHLLVATEAGRENLRAWVSAGRPAPTASLPVCTGDAAAMRLLFWALPRLPVPVRWHAVEHVAVEAVGFDSAAWIGPPATARPLVIRLSPHATGRALCHELAHAWHRRPTAAPLPNAIEWAAALMLVQTHRDAVWQAHADDEALADLLAAAWGL
jgi:hypothetical protein